MNLLREIKTIASKNNIPVYLVGGIVRDKLLGKKANNPDITVEGDGITFAKLLQKKLGGKLIVHTDFGTATLIFKTGKLDIATCREEKYSAPAKLPIVKKSTLLKDLKRRDFTINAIASAFPRPRGAGYQKTTKKMDSRFRGNDKPHKTFHSTPQGAENSKLNLGTNKLIDPFNGQKDLKLKQIRVLHDKSFKDDPTRIFRAFRFAGRLGFKIESKTEDLIGEAISGGFIEKLTSERIRNEIVLILKEPRRYEIMKLMNEFKPTLLKSIGLKMPDKKLFDNITTNLKLACFRKQIKNDWFIYFCGLVNYKKLSILNELPTPQAAGYQKATKTMDSRFRGNDKTFHSTPQVHLRRMEFHVKLTREELSILRQIGLLLSVLSELKRAKLPSEIYKRLRYTSAESLLFVISAESSVKDKILKFLTVYKKVRINITGKELAGFGIKSGPVYAELLSSILYAKLDGKVMTKADEIKFLKSNAG